MADTDADDTYEHDEAVEEALRRYKQYLWQGIDEGDSVDESIEAALEHMSDNEAFQELLDNDPDDLIGSIDAELAQAEDSSPDDDDAADQY